MEWGFDPGDMHIATLVKLVQWVGYLIAPGNTVPSMAYQAIIHSRLTARARPLWHHVHDYMTRTYRPSFISIYGPLA